MPVEILPNQEWHKCFCDICKKQYMLVDDAYLKYAGFPNKPKFSLLCGDCNDAILDRYINPHKYLVPVVVTEEVEDNFVQRKDDDMAQAVRNTISLDQLKANINWTDIEGLITAGNCKVKPLSEQLNANPVDLRNLLEEQYGNRIQFKRGRNGGVFWTSSN